MSKRKENDGNKYATNVNLVTAVLNLVVALILLYEKLSR